MDQPQLLWLWQNLPASHRQGKTYPKASCGNIQQDWSLCGCRDGLCCPGTPRAPAPIHCAWERCLSSAGLKTLYRQFCLLIIVIVNLGCSPSPGSSSTSLPGEAPRTDSPVGGTGARWTRALLQRGHGHVGCGHCQGWDTGSAPAVGTWDVGPLQVSHGHVPIAPQ